jgi:ribosomal protein S10
MIILKIRSIDQNSLMIYKNFLEDVLFKLVIRYKVSNIPTTKKRITLLKSPHVNKKSREQFQHTRYKVFFKIKNSLDIRAIKYMILNKPKTVKVVLIRDGD